MVEIFSSSNTSDVLEKLIDGHQFNYTFDIGYVVSVVSAKGAGSSNFIVSVGDTVEFDNVDAVVVSLKLYSVSEKRLLQFITEPAGAFFSGLIASIIAAAKRAYEWITAAGFAGFSFGALMTGLAEDWLIGALIAIGSIIFVWLLFERK